MINHFCLELEFISNSTVIELEEIRFTNCIFINLFIDNQALSSRKNFETGLLVWDELKRSLQGNGRYLIFTCACGIADDGGWEGVNIIHEQDWVLWEFEHANIKFNFQFKYSEYLNEINRIDINLKHYPNIILEPKSVIFPEQWHT